MKSFRLFFFAGFFVFLLTLTARANREECSGIFKEHYALSLLQNRQEHIPMSQNTTFELTQITTPDGVEKGELFHFQVRDEMIHQIHAVEGSSFRKQKVEIFQDNPQLFLSLGFKVATHPVLGEYWSEFPSPELLNSRILKWNEANHSDPHKQIQIHFATTGADNQTKMLKLWLDHFTIGVADPLKGFEEFYIPNGTEPPSSDLLNRLEARSVDGHQRVAEHNTLHRHDMDQVANALFFNQAYLAKTVEIQKFWAGALESTRANPRLVNGPRVQEFMRAFEGFTSRQGQTPFQGRQGMTIAELLKIYLHHGQRGLHSITHIASWLIKAPQGLDPVTFKETSRGVTFEIETSIHLAGLGRKAPGSRPPGTAPNLLLNWARATETGVPVTLESALVFTTNGEVARIREFVELVNDPIVTQLYQKMLSSEALSEVSTSTINSWAAEIRDRYQNALK